MSFLILQRMCSSQPDIMGSGRNTRDLRLINMYAKLGSVSTNMSKFKTLMDIHFLFKK